ncbi:hypothetical protein GCM10027270_00510 [Nocardioides ginkgobilobae]|jgi:hypothetical protein|uniref:Unannotated protein n=1 Tax=freshwater metagenome TaxID=449393 RepID=A0A6J6V1U6_9ZZZZ|nr:hypothetical protein [Actinomycetota bacterium]
MSSTVTMATRTVEVSGAWAGGTWIDAAVLAHAHRSARGGFDFTVRSAEVADALVAHGLASRVDGRTLRGSATVVDVCDVAPPRRPQPEQTVQAAREVRGWCSSTHHVEPVRAVVEGRRGRSAEDPWAEDVRLCGRCADLLGDAGFFQVA